MRSVAFLLGTGISLAGAIAACSSFSSSGEPPGSGGSANDGGSDAGSGDLARDGGPGEEADAAVATPCDAGSSRACGDRYVFLTTKTLYGDFADGGSAIAIAHPFCKTDAEQQGNTDLKARSWQAWICTDKASASGRVARTDARYITPSGVVVFDSTYPATNRVNKAPISGEQVVWTGCDGSGNHTGYSCTDWTDKSERAYYGDSSAANDRSWSSYATEYCLNQWPIYCFEEAP